MLLGFTAGVMLAATAFSLLVSALERGSVGEVLAGFALGAAALVTLDRVVPHAHARLRERGTQWWPTTTPSIAPRCCCRRSPSTTTWRASRSGSRSPPARRSSASRSRSRSASRTSRGFAAAAPLVALGTPRRRAAMIAAFTGAVEPPAAIAAYAATQAASAALPAGLGFAAGAMLYVIADELIPESHAGGHEQVATLAPLAGFALMLVLDNAFG